MSAYIVAKKQNMLKIQYFNLIYSPKDIIKNTKDNRLNDIVNLKGYFVNFFNYVDTLSRVLDYVWNFFTTFIKQFLQSQTHKTKHNITAITKNKHVMALFLTSMV